MANEPSRVLNNISAITQQHLVPAIVNQIIYSNYLAKRMLGKSKPVSGGDRIKQPLEYGEEDIAWLAEYDAVTFAPKEILHAAYYDWKWLNGTISLSEMDIKIKNVGKEAILDLVTTKSKNLARTFKRGFGQLLFKTTAAGANEPVTLFDIVDQNTTTLATINPTAYTWWKAKKLAWGGSTYANLTDSTHAWYIENVIRYMYGQLTNDSEHPTLIVTDQDMFDTYEMALHAQNRYQGKRSVDGGFELLAFRQCKMVVDSHIPQGKMYFLNENFLGFKHSKNSNFAFTPFKKASTGQHVYVAELDWHGAFCCSNRAYQGVVTGLPQSTITGTISS